MHEKSTYRLYILCLYLMLYMFYKIENSMYLEKYKICMIMKRKERIKTFSYIYGLYVVFYMTNIAFCDFACINEQILVDI